jgi:hypothetical protein
MAFILTDDGTLDTVLVCTECNHEVRYNFQESCLDNDEDGCEARSDDKAYADFVAWAITDADDEDDHDCPGTKEPVPDERTRAEGRFDLNNEYRDYI